MLKVYIWYYPLPLAYGLYTFKNVDNYGWPLEQIVEHVSCLTSHLLWVTQIKYIQHTLRLVIIVDCRALIF